MRPHYRDIKQKPPPGVEESFYLSLLRIDGLLRIGLLRDSHIQFVVQGCQAFQVRNIGFSIGAVLQDNWKLDVGFNTRILVTFSGYWFNGYLMADNKTKLIDTGF